MPTFNSVPITILHTNDMHGTLTPAVFENLKRLRSESDLYFDSGDIIKTGNLGIPIRPDSAWPMLDELRCDASVLGNRETHPLQNAADAKIAGASHPILAANVRDREGRRPFKEHLIIERSGIRIGVVGVMVPMATERMKTQRAWSYLWDPPLKIATQQAEQIRPQVDALFALTHIGHRLDRELANLGLFDVIFGGHSHTVIPTPEKHGRSWLVQGGSHNRFAGKYAWNGELIGGLVPISG